MKTNMYGITKEVIREIVNEVYGKDDESLVLQIESSIINRNNYPNEKYGAYMNLGGAWSNVGYLEVTNDKQRELASKIKELLIEKGFKVIDSNRNQYNETCKLGLGNGASFWFKD